MNKYRSLFETFFSLCINLLLVMVCFSLCRGIFLWENQDLFPDLSYSHLFGLFSAGLIFDLSAVLYTNLLYILMMLIPLHYKESEAYQKVAKWIFVVTNCLVILTNLADTVYFPYSNRRSTATFFSEFQNEDNLWSIFFREMFSHWYLLIAAALLVLILAFLYRKPRKSHIYSFASYYIVHSLILMAVAYPIIGGLRGGFGRQVRPITLSNANKYISQPIEAGIVLNTPFSIYQTLGVKTFPHPHFFDESQRNEMESIYTPVHTPKDSAEFRNLNVVILIMESFGKEYTGYLNQELDDSTYTGYTPFLDSLMKESLTFKHSFANGRKSIDAMPSILSGIPMFIEPFFLTPYSLNDLTSIAGELDKKGYSTSFFHGAKNGSMGFQSYANISGFKEYYGRTEYANEADYDGYWGIWDEPFLQYFAKELGNFRQPFASALFSVSSHHPFIVPKQYKDVFPKGTLPIHQCIGYTDHALREFFETVSKEPWFDNTLFVITGDHTNEAWHDEYLTESGRFEVPVIFYHHGSDLKGLSESIAQQIDIMPTVLSYLDYDSTYVSFGCDLLTTPQEETFAVNYTNGVYQFYKGDYLLQSTGDRPLGIYRFKTDRLLKKNLIGTVPEQYQMEKELQSIIQQYMERMVENRLK